MFHTNKVKDKMYAQETGAVCNIKLSWSGAKSVRSVEINDQLNICFFNFLEKS